MDELDGILMGATAAVAQEYFLLPVHAAHAVHRERVYCYELYHQLRCRWPEGCPYLLNGEVDKQQHPYFEEGGYPKPDFLVHVPGTGNNYAALEVKPPNASRKDIRKDISTLLRFRNWYPRSLYITYGMHPEAALERVMESAVETDQLAAIEIWVHPEVGAQALRLT